MQPRDSVSDNGNTELEAGRAILNNIGALMIRIGFRGPLYYNYNKEPRK